MAVVDQLDAKASMEKRHAGERVEIEVEPVAICTERLGEDMASEAGYFGVEKQGDSFGLYDSTIEQDNGLGSYHLTKDGAKMNREPPENQEYENMFFISIAHNGRLCGCNGA